MISLLEIKLKLGVILQSLSNRWKMLYVQSIKRAKIGFGWISLEWWEIFENANIEVKSQKETLAVEFEP